MCNEKIRHLDIAVPDLLTLVPLIRGKRDAPYEMKGLRNLRLYYLYQIYWGE